MWTGLCCSARMYRRPLGPLVGFLLVVATAAGCVPSKVMGPLQQEQEEREKVVTRARRSGVSEEMLTAVAPPLTPEELEAVKKENSSCRSSYMWKNGMTWTGSVFVAVAAGITIGGAYATGNDDASGKIIFGVSAGSLAALGAGLVAVGGIVQTGFTDRGCWVKK